MPSHRNRLYVWLSTLSIGAVLWIFVNLRHFDVEGGQGKTLCIFKNITGLACPSCGITRSVVLLVSGSYKEALLTNPLGFLALFLLALVLILIITDLITGKIRTMLLYNWVEEKFKHPIVYIPAIVIILLNWIWNIHKNI